METLLGFYNNTGILLKSRVMAATDLTLLTRYIPFPVGSRDISRCTVFCKAITGSSTKNVVVTAQMIYGGDVLGSSFTLGTVAATTSGVSGTYKLERDHSGSFDPNAEGIFITFTKTTGIQVTVEMGVNIA